MEKIVLSAFLPAVIFALLASLWTSIREQHPTRKIGAFIPYISLTILAFLSIIFVKDRKIAWIEFGLCIFVAAVLTMLRVKFVKDYEREYRNEYYGKVHKIVENFMEEKLNPQAPYASFIDDTAAGFIRAAIYLHPFPAEDATDKEHLQSAYDFLLCFTNAEEFIKIAKTSGDCLAAEEARNLAAASPNLQGNAFTGALASIKEYLNQDEEQVT